MSEKFQYGQDVISGGGSAIAGFNRRISGDSYAEAFQYEHERRDRQLYAGWSLADGMIEDGKIFYIHNFHHSHEGCSGHAFRYGNTMACNTCGRDGLEKEWWKIKVRRDGSAWHCIGVGFENLQESAKPPSTPHRAGRVWNGAKRNGLPLQI